MESWVTDAPAGAREVLSKTPGTERDLSAGVQPVIDMHGIVKRFFEDTDHELTVLKGFDLAIYPGEFVSIVGSSGSGKSTLMNIIGLLDRPTQGQYVLAGQDMGEADDDEMALLRSLSIGFVFQNFNLVGRTDAQKNVELPMMYAGVGRAERREHAAELLEMVGVADRAHHQPSELSGGQKQRVAIARAMANDPDIILADEPTGALDTETGNLVMELFHKLHRERGKTIVLITHNPELAAQTGRIFQMRDGLLDKPIVPAMAQSNNPSRDSVEALKNAPVGRFSRNSSTVPVSQTVFQQGGAQ